MGPNQGVIWNQSDWPIQYIIYGKFEECKDLDVKTQYNPTLKVDIGGTVEVSGFKKVLKSGYTNKYQDAFVTVQPGRFITQGLTNLKMDEHKISIRVKIGEFENYIFKDVVIRSISDITLKIRGKDLSVENLGSAEAKSIIEQNQKISLPNTSKEVIERRKNKYDDLLSNLMIASETAAREAKERKEKNEGNKMNET